MTLPCYASLCHWLNYSSPLGYTDRRGHWGLRFCSFGSFLPLLFGVLDFEPQFCGFLQHCGLRLLVLIVGSLQFAVVHGFSVA